MARATPSVITGGLRGKAGSVVFVRQPNGAVNVRPRISPANPNTSAQQAWRACVAAAGHAFSQISHSEYQAWQTYAQDQFAFGNLTNPKPSAAFTALAAKFIQVNGPLESPPLLPPSSAFQGDIVRVEAEFLSPTIVRFTGDRANQPGVVTEFLACKLRSRHERPRPRDFRILGHAAYEVGNLSIDFPVVAGHYALAIRFVSLETGQVSGLSVINSSD
ncbi:MAG: hypothetical protein IT206_04465 [Fimbriimonadaceae bacterium]|nr:hypothetical protein [Fimbriimonadaceae bacterium]